VLGEVFYSFSPDMPGGNYCIGSYIRNYEEFYYWMHSRAVRWKSGGVSEEHVSIVDIQRTTGIVSQTIEVFIV
jgi:hypothetical protein